MQTSNGVTDGSRSECSVKILSFYSNLLVSLTCSFFVLHSYHAETLLQFILKFDK